MKRSLLFTLFFALTGSALPARDLFRVPSTGAGNRPGSYTIPGTGIPAFDRGAFYAAMESGNLARIDSELSVVATLTTKDREAYEGALLMRKAGLLSRAKEKLATFRSGAMKLERCLARDSANAEFHFLRLIIQEHAPKILRYNKDRESDSRIVILAYPNLPPSLQKAVRDYCPHSRFIHESDLNG
ncbi:MAG TPA: hypothetical protein VN616_04400 [Puia sp.]|nr:hypothetical protein [Puia sp.]